MTFPRLLYYPLALSELIDISELLTLNTLSFQLTQEIILKKNIAVNQDLFCPLFYNKGSFQNRKRKQIKESLSGSERKQRAVKDYSHLE